MDVQTIEAQFQQVQARGQQTAQALEALGSKLQVAAQAGDGQAREWSLDLREAALSFKAGQDQMAALLQALHAGLAGAAQAPAAPSGVGEFLGSLLNSNFGRALESGAGFSIGSNIVNRIL